MLNIQNLTVGYSSPIVHAASLTLAPGEVVGLLGRNGSGKTTLLRGLCGSARVMGGSALLDGEDVILMKPRRRARCLSLLSQRAERMEGLRVGEVICMGRFCQSGLLGGISPQQQALCKQAAEELGIAHLWNRDCAALSEGQRQMVQLARVTAQDAAVLLLDEPSSALDLENGQRLFAQVKKLTRQKQKSALIVLHDPALALELCDRLVRMDQGRIAEVLPLAGTELCRIEAFLQPLCPGIRVKKDAETGSFYCIRTHMNLEPLPESH